MKWFARIASIGFALLRIWLIVGFALRITGLRDFSFWVQLPYFTTPWLVQAVGFGALVWWDRSRGRLAAAQSVLAVMALIGSAASSWRWAPEAAAKPDFRIVVWNVSRPERRLPSVAKYLRKQDADIIAIAEWRPRQGGSVRDWQRAFPGYQAKPMPGNMLLLARGKVTAEGTGLLEPSSFYALNRVRVGQREVLLLQADLYAGPFANRRPGMTALTELMAKHAGQPLILAGDLNTPRDSRLFDVMRGAHRHAFEEAGRGYAETWPLPLPVLGLDQVWVSGGFEVLRCTHGVTPWSDHRPLIVDLRWRSGSGPAAGR
ncbi:MAG: endonuclease/exonuclease/phosphatase family protein [Chthoniobacteraceae bacterium]